MSGPGHNSLRLPARLESLEPLRELALTAAAQAGLDELDIQRLDLVLEEALVNVMRHAYPAGSGEVELACGPDGPGRFRITLTDWGPAFDPLAPADPDLEERLAANREADLEGRAPGGLGLLFLRTLAAEVRYARQDGRNVLTLRFGA